MIFIEVIGVKSDLFVRNWNIIVTILLAIRSNTIEYQKQYYRVPEATHNPAQALAK